MRNVIRENVDVDLPNLVQINRGHPLVFMIISVIHLYGIALAAIEDRRVINIQKYAMKWNQTAFRVSRHLAFYLEIYSGAN